LKAPTHIPLEVWSKRGVCICVWWSQNNQINN
jgi:hypothetical protein